MTGPLVPSEPVQVALFAAFALLALIGAIRVVTASDPFISALALLFNFVSLGALYLLLDQPFVAISQVLVYAGAVVVLFLFVIAFLGDRRELGEDARHLRGLRPISILAGLAMGGLLLGIALYAAMPEGAEQLPPTEAGFSFGGAQAVGEVFLGRYLVAFEVTSLVLLVAAIGGIVLGLTGRARHARMRRLMSTRSADQYRRSAAERERELIARRRSERDDTSGPSGGREPVA